MNSTILNTQALRLVLKDIEEKVLENRAKFDDATKTIKDFRRIFDQESSRMNQAIFNDYPPEQVYYETLRTISVLVEILSHTKKSEKAEKPQPQKI
jgi:hypothetical protein